MPLRIRSTRHLPVLPPNSRGSRLVRRIPSAIRGRIPIRTSPIGCAPNRPLASSISGTRYSNQFGSRSLRGSVAPGNRITSSISRIANINVGVDDCSIPSVVACCTSLRGVRVSWLISNVHDALMFCGRGSSGMV
mmetsp:Transcript_22985/g.47411  ORF Transcript_22985/g.47411 Transcript_22985/m.47411 type:complete len:135 (+) Transcript_22985:2015-2419(+)